MTDSKLIDGLTGLKMEDDDSDRSVNESVNGGGRKVLAYHTYLDHITVPQKEMLRDADWMVQKEFTAH
ncbi:hypothetical protein B0A48_18401 [Cryoendolithus antarcticus]|uniref:Uncharacterized protein n=1 Tax=Cryoendolithus antarcticus TaxID=1507870 RepID=A0A1V8S984_9PEZI|nr:hypothetical protein B0A48_18401 [Cryoendolithus antarcticus]